MFGVSRTCHSASKIAAAITALRLSLRSPTECDYGLGLSLSQPASGDRNQRGKAGLPPAVFLVDAGSS